MLVLVTGGSGSGKSAYAEEKILSFGQGKRIYIATMFPFDKESDARILRHRQMRAGKGFETVERYTDLKGLKLDPDSAVLLECMSNLTANEMFQEEGAHERTVEAVMEGVKHLRDSVQHLVIVTNEIFSETAQYLGETALYQSYLGEINRQIAGEADEVTEVVYGIPVYQLGVNPPADIASGKIAEVRRRSLSCNCMTRTSQQECRGILKLKGGCVPNEKNVE